MNSEKTHIYFVPGMAAGGEIFRNIKFPENYRVHILEWLIPEKNESLKAYAERMARRIQEKNPILIGVSFGGVVAQEMNDFLEVKKLIIISSVKSKSELPRRMKLASLTKAYKLIPTGLVLSADDLTKYSIGPKTKKRLSLYQEYLHVRDKQYLDWALEKMITWGKKEKLQDVIHIHGEKDVVFPIKYIDQCEVIKGGTHIMILNRGREISQKLLDIFEE
ncbi:alpha/beta fold hydrolase [Aequorivita vladivostokensis]|uniref:Alpha/beta hydrolase n=1 Tax=Aequorivita vladivostokensis TaxID=171194 RepID=A0ABR5DKX1_9FLAO|nr:alpha/beta hydrolase [Aequorivita vladivostokensis]KJJ39431.1 alpha/beta hydrolase [Aequorivita vladivostokensis]MAB56328.1 alpha/beta hydrolase [Aequorivita sp.]MBF31398.1 alpha/beta hydrolase [Aequorivita sp.]|tara:strand:- start:63421 stop:64080 length:660 start_codon:yes stop_codon:yes gene_type:complete